MTKRLTKEAAPVLSDGDLEDMDHLVDYIQCEGPQTVDLLMRAALYLSRGDAERTVINAVKLGRIVRDGDRYRLNTGFSGPKKAASPARASDLKPFLGEPDVPPENHRIMAEWKAWQQVTRQVRALLPEHDDAALAPLVLAVQQWGEELHALRLQRKGRLELVKAREAYAPHRIGD